MTREEAARERLQLRRAKVSTRDTAIISDFEGACARLPLMFGGMFAVMYALIASGVVA